MPLSSLIDTPLVGDYCEPIEEKGRFTFRSGSVENIIDRVKFLLSQDDFEFSYSNGSYYFKYGGHSVASIGKLEPGLSQVEVSSRFGEASLGDLVTNFYLIFDRERKELFLYDKVDFLLAADRYSDRQRYVEYYVGRDKPNRILIPKAIRSEMGDPAEIRVIGDIDHYIITKTK